MVFPDSTSRISSSTTMIVLSLRWLARIGFVLLLAHPSSFVQAQDSKKAIPSTEGTLRLGDTGPAVEGLQRLLNARLSPSPELDADGDFGPATQAAITRFQRANGLSPTGLADEATRKALGPVPPGEPPVPSPESVNSKKLPKAPADSLDGPPFTTSVSWAIADGKTGETLWGQSENKPLEMASTTKMMTALIVVRLAKADAKVLDEIVTFSDRADKTAGSTSGVKAGEKVPVRELLYGLLLPSGNDAAEAFAEHFNARLAPEAGSTATPAAPIANFVAEMNRVALELGLRETHFANPHGLPAAGHKSSARDLAKLAQTALLDPTFAKVVGTARRGATLVDSTGQKRNVVWTNTNKLLETEGYDGVKTGTTNAAGACLVASGRLGNDHLIVVILGAQSSDGRYADARNLFRWAWKQRGHKSP
jgi:D-alanyl-D-alanine carboxypeptidase (penicillin-binding protein 5/6)